MKVLIGPRVKGCERSMDEFRRTLLETARDEFPGVEFVYCPRKDGLREAIADADVFVGWMGRDEFLAAKRLRWIQSPSSGVNYYTAIPELVESEVLLTSARGTHACAVAQSAIAMILARTRGIRDSILCQQEHRWGAQLRDDLVELSGSVMGVIGLGAIGSHVAELGHAFGMRVLAVDLYPDRKTGCVSELWGVDRLAYLLGESDYVVVTLPFTEKTDGLIGAGEIALMKPSAMLVGLGRGGIIDQDALVAALREKRLAAAAMDVFCPEPLPADSELWDLEGLLITPHIAGGTQLEAGYFLDIFRENLGRFLKDELPLRNQVDKHRGF